jgi:glycosyltransferase involved in cell wall biosynthesis
MATALAAHHGWRVHVAAGPGPHGTPQVPVEHNALFDEVRLPLDLRPVGAKWWKRRQNDVGWATSLVGLDALADQVQPDAILYMAHYSTAAEHTASLAAERRIPFIFLPALHRDHPRHTDRTARRLYGRADLVICLTEAEREWLVSRCDLKVARTMVFECGWQGPDLARSPRPNDVVRLLTVGGFAGHKQVDHQLRAVAFFREQSDQSVRLTVAGSLSTSSALDRLRLLARQLDLEDCLDVQPNCKDEQLAVLHGHADYFLFTSRSESLGLAVLDAIGFGVPPVVYPDQPYSDLVASSAFGVVTSRNTPRALAAGLQLAGTRRQLWDQSARLHWLGRRSWASASAPVAEAIQRLTTNTPVGLVDQ